MKVIDFINRKQLVILSFIIGSILYALFEGHYIRSLIVCLIFAVILIIGLIFKKDE